MIMNIGSALSCPAPRVGERAAHEPGESDAECHEPALASRELPRGHAEVGKLVDGYAARARSGAGPNSRQGKMAFGRSLHARTHESCARLHEGCRSRRGYA